MAKRVRRRITVLILLTIGISLTKLKESWQMEDEEFGIERNGPQVQETHMQYKSRHLLAEKANCTPAAIENFPNPLMPPAQRKQGGLLVHILIAAYMFWGLAIVCDEYFVPACEKICEVLGLESDVAGATFMAGGSSAPELAIAVIGVFIAEDDIALGTIVGSAFFNILFVIAFCALFAGSVIYLHWWPLLRDSSFYAVSILALVLTIYDGEIQWYEALSLLVLYIVYCLFMVVNKRIENAIVPKFSCCNYTSEGSNSTESSIETIPVMSDANSSKYTEQTSDDASGSSDEEVTEFHILLPANDMLADEKNVQLHDINGGIHNTDDDCTDTGVKRHLETKEADEHLLSVPQGCCRRIAWLLSLPLLVAIFLSVPDIRRPRWAKCLVVCFVMSIVWIGVFSYVMVWMIAIVGHTLGIPDTVMGITFMAAGSSAPDVFSSYLVLKDGLGDMAVSNAIGSNIFDILMCIGIPYLIRTFSNGSVEVYSHGLAYSSIALFSTVILLPVSMHINGWKLDVKYGVLLMVFYVLFITLSILFELNIFGHVRPPTCPSDF